METHNFDEFYLEDLTHQLELTTEWLEKVYTAIERLPEDINKKFGVEYTVEVPELAGTVKIGGEVSAKVVNLDGLLKEMQEVKREVKQLKLNPEINVAPAKVDVNLKELDRLTETIKKVITKQPDIRVEAPQIDNVTVNLDKYTRATNPLAVRLSNGRNFVEALTRAISSSGVGYPTIKGTLANGEEVKLAAVELSGYPGRYALVVANADGTAISGGSSGGGGTPEPSNTYGTATYGSGVYA